jgi:hypothetical protein
MDHLETSIAEMWIDEDGIMHIKIKKGVHFTLENTKSYYQDTEKLADGKKVLVLLDATEEYTIAEDASVYMNSEEANRNRIAVAFVTRSLANQLLFNFVNGFNKDKRPRRMFSDREKALKWLKTFFILPGDKFERKKK